MDPVDACGDGGVSGLWGLMAQGREHGVDRIMAGPARSKAIAVGFKARFPFGFEHGFGQGWERTVCHHGDAEGPLLGGVRCGDPDPAYRLGLLPKSQEVDQRESLGWRQ